MKLMQVAFRMQLETQICLPFPEETPGWDPINHLQTQEETSNM